MDQAHVTLEGTILAVAFLASIVGVITWMLDVPEQTPTTLRVARAVRQTEHANRVLVPIQGTALSDRVVALGAQMAKDREAQLEVLYVIEVPWTLPLGARLEEAESTARETLDRARRIADRFGVTLESRIVQARDAGPAIVDEAERSGADIILMADLPGRAGDTRSNATTLYVFRQAPCEVIIDRPSTDGRQAAYTALQRPGEPSGASG